MLAVCGAPLNRSWSLTSGGTKVAAAVLEPGLVVSSRREMATQAAEGPERVAERVAALGRALLESYAATHGEARPRRAVPPALDRSTDRPALSATPPFICLAGSAFRWGSGWLPGWKFRWRSTTM
jgi:hypothetical protein